MYVQSVGDRWASAGSDTVGRDQSFFHRHIWGGTIDFEIDVGKFSREVFGDFFFPLTIPASNDLSLIIVEQNTLFWTVFCL